MRGPLPMRALTVVALLAVAALAACGGGGGGSSSGGSTPGGGGATTCPLPTPIASARFSSDILPALQGSCGSSTSTCHGQSNPPAGHVRFDTSGGRTASDVYAELVNAVPSNAPTGWFRVRPNDVSKSWIIEKVTSDQPGGAGFGARMPLAAPNLCTATVDNLKAWINAGAPF